VSGGHVQVQAGGRIGWSDFCEDGELEQQGWTGRTFTEVTGTRRSEALCGVLPPEYDTH